MRKVFIDSAGIGLICDKYLRLKKENKKFALCNLSANFYNMLGRLDLTDKIGIYSDVHSAVQVLGIKTETQKIKPLIEKTGDKYIE